jgi:hypothetical protein
LDFGLKTKWRANPQSKIGNPKSKMTPRFLRANRLCDERISCVRAYAAFDKPALLPARKVISKKVKKKTQRNAPREGAQRRRFDARFLRADLPTPIARVPARAGAKVVNTGVSAGRNLPGWPTAVLSGRGDNTTPVVGRLIPLCG